MRLPQPQMANPCNRDGPSRGALRFSTPLSCASLEGGADSLRHTLNIEDRAARYDFTGTDVSKPYTILAIADTIIAGFVTTLPSRLADLPQDAEVGAL